MLILHQILKAQKSLNHQEYCYHTKQFIMTSAHSYCNIHYPYTFHMLCIILSIVNFHTVLSMFLFLFYWLHLKADAIHLSDSSCFVKGRSVERTSCNSWKWRAYTLSNIMYIAFQNSYPFLRSFPWQAVTLKRQINQLKNICSGVYLSTKLKIEALQLSKKSTPLIL